MNWVPVKNFPGYSVNPLGQVRNDSTGRLLHIRLNREGVPYVGMMRNNRQVIRSLPLLVAEAFLPKTNKIFDTPVSIDGDRSNCAVDNLMWRPRWYAVLYNRQFRVERYENAIHAPVVAVETDEVFSDSLAAACRYGLLEREVVLSVLNRTPTWPTYQTFELAEPD
jgi:hypothetical protein